MPDSMTPPDYQSLIETDSPIKQFFGWRKNPILAPLLSGSTP
ncbi:hypothetical protein [Dechloromonas denitrificans]|nr:hypothetical protein [Dechloromonas denitrificans]